MFCCTVQLCSSNGGPTIRNSLRSHSAPDPFCHQPAKARQRFPFKPSVPHWVKLSSPKLGFGSFGRPGGAEQANELRGKAEVRSCHRFDQSSAPHRTGGAGFPYPDLRGASSRGIPALQSRLSAPERQRPRRATPVQSHRRRRCGLRGLGFTSEPPSALPTPLPAHSRSQEVEAFPTETSRVLASLNFRPSRLKSGRSVPRPAFTDRH